MFMLSLVHLACSPEGVMFRSEGVSGYERAFPVPLSHLVSRGVSLLVYLM